MREIITLQCPECKNRNYSTTKNKKTTTGRLEFSKFCNTCRKHTASQRDEVRAGRAGVSASRERLDELIPLHWGSKLNG